MKRIFPLVLAIWGSLIIYRGFTGELPANPQTAYEWGSAAGFGLGIVLVAIGALAVWQGHLRLGWRVALIVAVLAVAGTYGSMRLQTPPAKSDTCAAAIKHMRALFVAGDPGGSTVKRLDNRRAAMMKRCESESTTRDRACILSSRSIADLQRCPRW